MPFFFFFQAEDGIRDLTVTGVQTCALPISITAASPAPNRQTFATGPYSGLFGWVQGYSIQAQVNGQGGTKARLTQVLQHTRSEERRVGKECRSRWSPYH